MLADYHVHTEYSDDSVYPMEEVVKDAVRMAWRNCALQIMWIME